MQGEYREPALSGSARGTVVKLTNMCAIGRVDGRDAAAVILVTDPGGSGTFYDLALLRKREDGWINVDTVPLGDRIRVHAVGMKDHEIFIRMSTHRPGDPLCCPTEEVSRRFALQADRLVAKGEERRPGVREQEIIGPVWKWVRTQYSNDTALISPADTPGYTFQMRQDGTIQVRGDCNRGGGSFILNGRSLAIMITHTTRAACPEGSLEDAFIRDLNRTGGWLLKNGRLFLDLKYDSGTMEFRESRKSAGE
jgi:heat shock protein HslJ